MQSLQEVRLFTSNAERERLDELATLYGLVTSLDYLERAYVRDSITQAQCVLGVALSLSATDRFRRYGPACTRLLAQYKTIMKLVGDAVPSLETFMSEYRVRSLARCAVCMPDCAIGDADGLPCRGVQAQSGRARHS